MGNKKWIVLAGMLLASSSAHTYESQQWKDIVTASVTAIYYQNKCNPGALSLHTIQFMAQLIKAADPETVETARRNLIAAVQRYGGSEQYCAAMNTPGMLRSMQNLQKAIEALPKEGE